MGRKHKKKSDTESSSSSESNSSSSSEEEVKIKKRHSKKSKKSDSEDSSGYKKTSTSKKTCHSQSPINSDNKSHKIRKHEHQETVQDKYFERKHKHTSNDRTKECKHQDHRGEEKYKYKNVEREQSRSHNTERDDSRRRDHNRDRDRNRNDYRRDGDRNFKDDDGYRNRDRRDYKGRNNNRRDHRRRSSSFDHANAKWGRNDESGKGEKKHPEQKEKPNFGLSGKLTEETNTYKGIVIKYSEPPEARKPRRRWRLYPFKGEKALQTLYIHRESAYLIGRERKVVDLPVDHPSCSKQHAALQYRLVPFTREDGSAGKRVRPYLIDLESANGTFINNKKIEPKKYVELLERDVIKFGFSSREYVLLHENSKDEAMDDDVKQEEEDVKVKVKAEAEGNDA